MGYSNLVVDLDLIKYNINNIKLKQNEDTKIIAMVKANAYGLGALEVSKYLEENSLVDMLSVAYIKEAIFLKEQGIKLPVLVSSASTIDEVDKMLDTDYYNDICISISDVNFAVKLNRLLILKNIKLKVHIKINTGMNRFGLDYLNATYGIKKISSLENIVIEGIYTHFASADSDTTFLNVQKQRFDTVLDDLEELKINVKYIHACNSAASTIISTSRYNAVRTGIMMYGFYSNERLKKYIDLIPACKLSSQITSVSYIKAGDTVSYDKTFVAKSDMKIAVVNIGYADGLKRELSNKGYLIVKSKKCKILGNICMDACVIDITDFIDINIGQEVYIFDNKNQFVEDIARLTGTINYEILSTISDRVDRIYKRRKNK